MYGTYCRLRVPVWASSIDVIRAVRRKFKAKVRKATDKATREGRKDIYREMLKQHERAREIVREWRL